MKLTEVIRRPLVTEKTTIAREAAARWSCSKWRATRPRSTSSAPSRSCSASKVAGGAHADRARQDQAPGPVRRASARTGRRPGSGSRPARRCRNSSKARRSAGIASCRFATTSRRQPAGGFRASRRSTRSRRRPAAQAADRDARAIGRPQQPRRADVVVARRRAQAQLPHHRLQAGQVQHPGQGRRRSSTTRTASARIALVTYADGEKRYILHPLGLKVGDPVMSGDERRHPAGQLPAAQEHSARHDDSQRRAEAGQGRTDRAVGRIGRAAGRQGRASTRR